jgi:hypothetical protein
MISKPFFPSWRILTLATVIKAVLMTVTVFSPDLASVVSSLSRDSKLVATPFGALSKLVLLAWQMLPVDHPVIPSSWNPSLSSGTVGLYSLIFMMKLPLLILDILTGVLLYRTAIVQGLSVGQSKLAFYLWFLNPYVFLVNEMWAAVDLLPTFFLVMAAVLVQSQHRRTRTFGALAFGAATALKFFPIILLPAFFLMIKQQKSRFLFVLSGIIGSILYFSWVFYVGYDPLTLFRQYTPYTYSYDEFVILTSIGQNPIGLATLTLTITYALFVEKLWKHIEGVLDAILLILLAYFTFVSWFPQFLIWMIPFLTIDAVKRQRNLLFMAAILLSAAFIDIATFSGYFTANGIAFFFVPAVGPALSGAVRAYENFVGGSFVADFALPLARAFFIATCMSYAITILNRRGLVSRFLEILTNYEHRDAT